MCPLSDVEPAHAIVADRLVKLRSTANAAAGSSDSARELNDAAKAPPGLARIGKYDVQAEIGNGSRIKVFSGTDPLTGRPVTLKLLLDIAGADFSRRFRADVTVAARISCPEFASIYELGEHVGFPFVAMQRAGDDDIRRVLKRLRFVALLQRVSIMWDVAEGARAAHAAGLTYIGVRPSAIGVTERERALIQDFGIVRANPETEQERSAYLSPEELSGVAPDVLSDVFAFGVLYYQLLTGEHPFLNGDGQVDMVRQPRLVTDLVPECPEALGQLVRRTIEKDRSLRFQTFEEVQEEAAPVVRELKRARATALAEQARALLRSGETERAQNVVRGALEMDPGNAEAESLRREIRNMLRRQLTPQQVDALVRRAELAAAANDYDQALQILDSSVGAEVTDHKAATSLAVTRRRLDAARQAAQLTVEARKLAERGRYADAREAVRRAMAADAGFEVETALLADIDDGLKRQEQEAKVDQGLVQVKSLLLSQAFDEALACLKRLDAECPGFDITAQWIERVESQKAASESKMQMEARLAEIRLCLNENRFDEALSKLQLVGAQFPEADVSGLVTQAREAKTLAAAVDQVLLDAAWMMDKDRPDLAMQLLREKEPALGADSRFAARLSQTASALAKWRECRVMEECMRQVKALEGSGQWTVALTVLEEFLEGNPGAAELSAEAERVRQRIRQQEYEQRVQQRLKAISRKIAAKQWPQALGLIDAARKESPQEAELGRLEEAVLAAQRAEEYETLAAEIRQLIADGEIDQCEELLFAALEKDPEERLLLDLRAEIEEAKCSLSDWREAQALVGRRKFEQAEAILARLAGQQRPEADVLLELVREFRTANEEEGFYKSGVEKAQKLIEADQLNQAADLLRNLLSLFPGDPILERQFRLANRFQSEDVSAGASSPAVCEPEEVAARTDREPPPERDLPSWFEEPNFAERISRRRSLRTRIGVAALTIMVAAILWDQLGARIYRPEQQAAVKGVAKTSKPTLPPNRSKAASVLVESPKPVGSGPAAMEPEDATPGRADHTQRRLFDPPSKIHAKSEPVELAAPPASPPFGASAGGGPSLPATLFESSRPLPEPPAVAQEPRTTQGGSLKPAVLVSRVMPQRPAPAARVGMAGAVELEASIDPKGVVSGVKIISGNPMLAAAAKDAVLKWRYEPAMLNGQSIDSKQVIRVLFENGR